MRIAELSRRTATSVPSIKYYLREGLLPAGIPVGRNQAAYSADHVHRLRLIRALIDVGGLSIAAARDVIAAVEAAGEPSHDLLGIAHSAVGRAPRRDAGDPEWRTARAEVAQLVRQRGWLVDEDCPDLDHAADAVAALRALGQGDLVALAEVYADAAERVASHEVGAVLARTDPARMVEGVVTGTILGEALLTALRRLAQQDASARRLTKGRAPS